MKNEDKLKTLRTTLEERRKRSDLIYKLKKVHE